MAFAANLNLGHTSRGRLSLDPSTLNVQIAKSPYFNDPGDHDFSAVLSSATALWSRIQATLLQTLPNAYPIFPPAGLTMEQYLRGSEWASTNHWVGTAKMSERCGEGGAVVDTTTKVCGMRNLHVVDASIVNGNPSRFKSF